MQEEKKKIGILVCVVFCMMFFVTGCDSMEDKKNIKKWEAQASENASYYIKEKYGFKAKVKTCECGRTEGLFGSSPYSECLVTMKYGNRKFYVWIDGENENADGIDNYQAKEVSKALKEEIVACIGEKPAYFRMMQKQCPFCSGLDAKYDNMFHAYYDGTNLYELLAEDSVECAIFFDNGRDVSKDSLDAIRELMDFSGNMGVAVFEEISFVSEEGLQVAKNEVISDLRCNSGAPGIRDERIYIDNILSVSYWEDETEKETSRYVKKQCGDVIYCYEEEENTDWEMKEAGQNIDIDTFKGHGFIEPKGISESYAIANQTNVPLKNAYISVYFPKEMIQEKDTENVQIAYTFVDEEGELYKKTAFIDKIGDYYTGTISCIPDERGIQFMLAVDEE